jgi:trans-aconitate 2-methyltransferase
VTSPADTGRGAEDVGGRDSVDWDAATYDRVADPQEEWGRAVLARLDLKGDETILDAGCGSGRVTKLLVEAVPDGRVIGVDASESMIETARANLGPGVELIHADLLDLELGTPVDVVYSNATFHWVQDHELLFQRLHAVLEPGGRLEAQCGGQGNIAEFARAIEAAAGDERFAAYLTGDLQAWNFASVGDTRTRLMRAGFDVKDVWLENKPVQPEDPVAFSKTVGMAWHLNRLPERLHDDFVKTVLGSMLRPLVLEYVRLNMSAVA